MSEYNKTLRYKEKNLRYRNRDPSHPHTQEFHKSAKLAGITKNLLSKKRRNDIIIKI